jgi:hypothetical protein
MALIASSNRRTSARTSLPLPKTLSMLVGAVVMVVPML